MATAGPNSLEKTTPLLIAFIGIIITASWLAANAWFTNVPGTVMCSIILALCACFFFGYSIMLCHNGNVSVRPASEPPRTQNPKREERYVVPIARDPELAAAAECPVCFTAMRPNGVAICGAMHNGTQCGFAVCAECKGRMNACAQCRAPFGSYMG